MVANSIIAAGAVVVRGTGDDREYLIIHRDHRSDWTFPKGKLDPGEHILAAAIREVREETGFAVILSGSLPTQMYLVKGFYKYCHYWLAHIVGGEYVPNQEVDEIRWCNYKQARKLLTYAHDMEVLDAANSAVLTTAFIVLRHAQATKRAEWLQSTINVEELDINRPLTGIGRIQSFNIASALAAYGVTKLNTSDSKRCQETLSPYAGIRGLPISLEPDISEEHFETNPEATTIRTKSLMNEPSATVLCTHRPVLPKIMETLNTSFNHNSSENTDFSPVLTPGSFVVFHRDPTKLNRLVQVERHIR